MRSKLQRFMVQLEHQIDLQESTYFNISCGSWVQKLKIWVIILEVGILSTEIDSPPSKRKRFPVSNVKLNLHNKKPTCWNYSIFHFSSIHIDFNYVSQLGKLFIVVVKIFRGIWLYISNESCGSRRMSWT